MAYATTTDLQGRMTRTLSDDEIVTARTLLCDAAVMIDAIAPNAPTEAKRIVSCRMVIRAIGDGSSYGVPTGATQGSMSGLGYSQSWTISSGGSTGEMYLTKADRLLLGAGNKVGSRSPIETIPEAIP